jgi:hypothetical protein
LDVDLTDRLQQIIRGGFFRQIAGSACSNRLAHMRVVTVTGEDEHFGGRNCHGNLAGRFHPVQERHREIHHDDIGPKPFGFRDRLMAVLCLANDLDVCGCFKEMPQPSPNNAVIVRKQYRNWIHRKRVGASGVPRL